MRRRRAERGRPRKARAQRVGVTKRRREARPTTRPTSGERATRTTTMPVNARGKTTPSKTQSATRQRPAERLDKRRGRPKAEPRSTRTTTVPTSAGACDEDRALRRICPYAGIRASGERQAETDLGCWRCDIGRTSRSRRRGGGEEECARYGRPDDRKEAARRGGGGGQRGAGAARERSGRGGGRGGWQESEARA